MKDLLHGVGVVASAFLKAFLLLVALCFLFMMLFPPNMGGIKKAPQSSAMQTAHVIGLAMYSYANDNNQMYPQGNSSTEVFQKLVDGGYISDPAIFYFPAPGKIKAQPGQKILKPENVCWDVTADLSSTDSGESYLPLLFLTGYRVSYAPGGAAVPLTQANLPSSRTWDEWRRDEPNFSSLFNDGIAVFYVNNSSKYINRTTAPDGSSSIPNFISPDYKPDGTTYRQLTPDGVLGP